MWMLDQEAWEMMKKKEGDEHGLSGRLCGGTWSLSKASGSIPRISQSPSAARVPTQANRDWKFARLQGGRPNEGELAPLVAALRQ